MYFLQQRRACNFTFVSWFQSGLGKENNSAEKYGEQITSGSVCDSEARGFFCRKLGRWLGLHRFNEVWIKWWLSMVYSVDTCTVKFLYYDHLKLGLILL